MKIDLGWGVLHSAEPLAAFATIEYDDQNNVLASPLSPKSQGGSRKSSIRQSTTDDDDSSAMIAFLNGSSAGSNGKTGSSSEVTLAEEAQVWAKFAPYAKTAMVVSLNLLKFLDRRLVLPHAASWSLEQYDTFLVALEVSYRHAAAFNTAGELRKALQKGFSGKVEVAVPNLLGQEVLSLDLMLKLLLHLFTALPADGAAGGAAVVKGVGAVKYRCTKAEAQTFVQPWLERLGAEVLRAYCELSDGFASALALPGGADGAAWRSAAGAISRDRFAAYESAAAIVLSGVLRFSPSQFALHQSWLLPALARLVVCGSLRLRSAVATVYTAFVYPLAEGSLRQ